MNWEAVLGSMPARVQMVVAWIRAVIGEMGSKKGLDIDIIRLADSLDRGKGKRIRITR